MFKEKRKTENQEILDCLRMNIDLGMLTAREAGFAEGLLKFHQHHGYLSERQESAAKKLLMRVIMEREIPV